ncbi:hypothetical protein GGI12_000951 [Dipsacomyces acuminosporus]|nr:hypothetical protein GGI12_000951 [Dipsacomyces acuminosporus]
MFQGALGAFSRRVALAALSLSIYLVCTCARDIPHNSDSMFIKSQESPELLAPEASKKTKMVYGMLLVTLASVVYAGIEKIRTAIRFAYNCFFKPLGLHSDQQSRLDAFYEGQADVYDSTRGGLLRGRKTMLKLCAAELNKLKASQDTQEFAPIWVDIGGGTGWNIEQMNEYFPISNFKTVYLIDLCRPLCKVAEQRFQAKGWKNVRVLCQDASTFSLPELENGKDRGQIDLVTMSYSLSMIEDFYPVVDRISTLVKPQTGLVGVADFYVSGSSGPNGRRQSEKAGILGYQCNWFTRVFWQHWFEFDHVYLHPCRRNYLEYKFSTHKAFNGRNHFVIPYLVQMPYYVWLGATAASTNTSLDSASGSSVDLISEQVTAAANIHHFDASGKGSGNAAAAFANPSVPRIDSGFITPGNSPKHLPAADTSSSSESSQVNLGSPALRPASAKPSAPKKQAGGWERMPYQPSKPEHSQFGTYIYGFTWEDPRRDIEVLDLDANDNIMVITSAGDNALAYAVHQPNLRIQCIDMNPCQNHLLELKLAALRTLDYSEFWQMFGQGTKSDFLELLDTKLSAELSSSAYQFWRRNVSTFAPRESKLVRLLLGDLAHRNLYTTGYSGLALHCLRVIAKLLGFHKVSQSLTQSPSLDWQRSQWNGKIRNKILSNLGIRFMDNPVAMWQLLGVPINQWNMLRSEGSMAQYMADTLDPVASSTSFADDNYFYHLLFARQYSPECCPDYLTPKGFGALKKAVARDNTHTTFRLHTSTILDVLHGLQPGELTKAVIMDHMDWFSADDADEEVVALARAIKKGGFVLWRSAARVPWYIKVFEKQGFAVQPLSIREPGSLNPIDRVNMYASFYKAVKL